VIVNAIGDLRPYAREFPRMMTTGKSPKLEDQLREVMRVKHSSFKTELLRGFSVRM
jgi:hypothetical protein